MFFMVGSLLRIRIDIGIPVAHCTESKAALVFVYVQDCCQTASQT